MVMTPRHFFFVVLVHLADCRGPHHPRGEPVAKHVHYRPTKTQPEKILEDTELLHDKEHLKEHLEDVISVPDFSKMSSEEIEFYYFQVHDSDKNSKLDGLELLQAIQHTVHNEQHDDEEEEEINPTADFEYFIEIIDNLLADEDIDGDGYLSYPEYASGRKKALLAERAQQPVVKMIT